MSKQVACASVPLSTGIHVKTDRRPDDLFVNHTNRIVCLSFLPKTENLAILDNGAY
jgi:hypothetical protein